MAEEEDVDKNLEQAVHGLVSATTVYVTHHGAVIDDIVDFARKYTPAHIREHYSKPRFRRYWSNRFLDHVSVGMKHPVVDAQTGRPVHPLFLDDAITMYNLGVITGEPPEYKFPNHDELVEYAVFATLYDVMQERLRNQNT